MKKIFLLFLIFGFISYSQNLTVDNDKDFNIAVGLYNANKYSDALSLFQKIAKRTENNSKTTAASFFICKTYDVQKKYTDVEKQSKSFLLSYPQSKYSNEIKILLLKSFIDREDYQKAFKYSLEFLDGSSSIVFNKELKSNAEKISTNYLSSSEVEMYFEQYSNSTSKSFLLLLSGKILLREGDILNALKRFSEIITKHPSSDEYVEALNLKKQYSNQLENEFPIVGVILSLTDQNGREIESASEILEGIKYAFHEYNTAHNEKVGISIKDLQRDKIKVESVISELIADNNMRCIIGPVFSDDVRSSLEAISSSNLCLISPTATDDDLISLNNNFYQANPSLSTRGKIFAQYLYFVENKRKLAVLNAIEGYSPLLAASFTNEFEKLGGKIIAKETYKSKSYSLADQINRILSVANSIEGIYAPISDSKDATAILSQMVQSGLNMDLYGNQDWFLGKGFESSSTSANKLTFESDYFIDFNDPDFKSFSSSFKKITGKETNRNVLYGYDSAKYLLTVIRNIDPTRRNIKNKIESGINVTGFHNNISFDYDRINKYLNIVRFDDGVFNLVEKFRSGK